jgi:uncharacterized protein with von Willebrand factor type A (vWA) domain
LAENPSTQNLDPAERQRRWRLALGAEPTGSAAATLTEKDRKLDGVLGQLYDASGQAGDRSRGGLNASSPNVARWLGDIRSYFPSSVVRVMQKDAMTRLNLHQMLLEPEILQNMQPDVHLVASIMSLSGVIPEKTKHTARMVVRHVVNELMKRLEAPMRQAITGSLNRATRNMRPRYTEIDWNRTIRANLKHYQPTAGTIIPERLIGYGRKKSQAQREIILCIDQSGSMASSIVYSSIFGAVMASLPAVRTRLVLFDTSVVDLSDKLEDPVDILFGVQLGGGTDIRQALTYCHGLVQDPTNAIIVLISDLIEGGDQQEMFKRVASIIASGAQLITLLALSDEGAPTFSHEHARMFAELGSPAFACTPDKFPDLMAAAITRCDVNQWAAENNIVTSRPAQ